MNVLVSISSCYLNPEVLVNVWYQLAHCYLNPEVLMYVLVSISSLLS